LGPGWLTGDVLALGTPSLFRERKKGKPCLAYHWPRASFPAGDGHAGHAEERGDLFLGAAPLALCFVF
jgi:hypothetical protein